MEAQLFGGLKRDIPGKGAVVPLLVGGCREGVGNQQIICCSETEAVDRSCDGGTEVVALGSHIHGGRGDAVVEATDSTGIHGGTFQEAHALRGGHSHRAHVGLVGFGTAGIRTGVDLGPGCVRHAGRCTENLTETVAGQQTGMGLRIQRVTE